MLKKKKLSILTSESFAFSSIILYYINKTIDRFVDYYIMKLILMIKLVSTCTLISMFLQDYNIFFRSNKYDQRSFKLQNNVAFSNGSNSRFFFTQIFINMK